MSEAEPRIIITSEDLQREADLADQNPADRAAERIIVDLSDDAEPQEQQPRIRLDLSGEFAEDPPAVDDAEQLVVLLSRKPELSKEEGVFISVLAVNGSRSLSYMLKNEAGAKLLPVEDDTEAALRDYGRAVTRLFELSPYAISDELKEGARMFGHDQDKGMTLTQKVLEEVSALNPNVIDKNGAMRPVIEGIAQAVAVLLAKAVRNYGESKIDDYLKGNIEHIAHFYQLAKRANSTAK